MKIPRYTAKISPLGRASETLFKIHQKRQAVDDRNQYDTVVTDIDSYAASLIQTIEQNAVIKSVPEWEKAYAENVANLDRFRQQARKKPGIDSRRALELEEGSYRERRLTYENQIRSVLSGSLYKNQELAALKNAEKLLEAGDIEGAVNLYDFLDEGGIITAQAAENLKNEAPKEASRLRVLMLEKQIDVALRTRPKEEVDKMVSDALTDPVILPSDKPSLWRYVENMDKVWTEKREEDIRARSAEATNELFTQLLDPEQNLNSIVIEQDKRIFFDDQRRWMAIADKQTRKNMRDDWKAYNEQINTLLTYWDDELFEGKEGFQLGLAETAYVKGKLSRSTLSWFAQMLDKELSTKDRGNLKKIFNRNKDSFWWPLTEANTTELIGLNKAAVEEALKGDVSQEELLKTVISLGPERPRFLGQEETAEGAALQALQWKVPEAVDLRIRRYTAVGWSSTKLLQAIRSFPDISKITVKQFDARMKK